MIKKSKLSQALNVLPYTITGSINGMLLLACFGLYLALPFAVNPMLISAIAAGIGLFLGCLLSTLIGTKAKDDAHNPGITGATWGTLIGAVVAFNVLSFFPTLNILSFASLLVMATSSLGGAILLGSYAKISDYFEFPPAPYTQLTKYSIKSTLTPRGTPRPQTQATALSVQEGNLQRKKEEPQSQKIEPVEQQHIVLENKERKPEEKENRLHENELMHKEVEFEKCKGRNLEPFATNAQLLPVKQTAPCSAPSSPNKAKPAFMTRHNRAYSLDGKVITKREYIPLPKEQCVPVLEVMQGHDLSMEEMPIDGSPEPGKPFSSSMSPISGVRSYYTVIDTPKSSKPFSVEDLRLNLARFFMLIQQDDQGNSSPKTPIMPRSLASYISSPEDMPSDQEQSFEDMPSSSHKLSPKTPTYFECSVEDMPEDSISREDMPIPEDESIEQMPSSSSEKTSPSKNSAHLKTNTTPTRDESKPLSQICESILASRSPIHTAGYNTTHLKHKSSDDMLKKTLTFQERMQMMDISEKENVKDSINNVV